ncbi:ATP-binding cassette domain-containing protein [Lentilactobacillus senioris]|uniref:ABC transporter ATP-binding protein n=1 Tax=Lentilactobacillus senioris TaxID=931534 RepID=UPI002282C4BD|nr:ATP-binding cassette domain-containing protein [Lentilactobacillus senioris]MCY9806141.1 ATP-binding cassette domain-containing protein [Lentilactobacillus senioris]
MNNSTAILEIQSVNKVFFTENNLPKHILKDINLTIYPGDFISVIGNNGAGKSTLLNVIAGNLTADTGSIYIKNRDVTNQNVTKRAKHIARVFQDPQAGTAGELTSSQNLAVASSKRHFSLRPYRGNLAPTELKSLLQQPQMGLERFMDTPAKYLSGGQRQVLSLLMAAQKQPDLLLLDEHTAALDPKTSAAVMKLTANLVNSQRLTSLMITHKMEDALYYGNRLIMVQDGQITHDVRGDDKEQLTVVEVLEWFE